MTLQSKSLQPNLVSVAEEPILVSLEGTYQQHPVQLGNDNWIFFAAKVRNADPTNQGAMTTFLRQQAQKLAAQPASLPLDQEVIVKNVGGASADGTAFFGGYNTNTGEYIWFHIIFVTSNTGPGAPYGSISVDHNGRQINCGDWACVPFVHHNGESPFIYFDYANNNDTSGIGGAFSLSNGPCQTAPHPCQ